jgi:hypothetical protein
MSIRYHTIFYSNGFLLCSLILLLFIACNKTAEGSENILSHYSILFVPKSDVIVDPNRLEKSFPGDFDCAYDIYAYVQLLRPDPSDSSQQPFSYRKKPRGILTKSPESKILTTPDKLFIDPVLTYKNYQSIVLIFFPKFVGYKLNIRPPPFLTDRR